MAKTRQRRSAQFKFQVALEALKEQKTLSQLASEYEVHPTQITQWKKQVLDGVAASSVSSGRASSTSTPRGKPNSSSRSGGSRWSWSG